MEGAPVLAVRVSFVGELGWELYPPADAAGLGLSHAVYHALDTLRMEKGYRHWGHDVGTADTPLEAGWRSP